MMTKRFLTKLPLATFRAMWYSPPFLGHHAGVSAPALFQPQSLDCGLGGKQKSHRVYSLSQVPGASEFVSYFWHFYSSPRSCCHLTALHVSQSEGLTRFFKWFHHCVAGRGKQLKWREINSFSALDQNTLPKLILALLHTLKSFTILYSEELSTAACYCFEVGDFQWAAGE